MAKKKLVLVAAWFVNDDWYGKRYRAILSPAEGETFSSVTEAKNIVVH